MGRIVPAAALFVQRIPVGIVMTSLHAQLQVQSGAALIALTLALFAVQITLGIVSLMKHALEWVQTGAATGALISHAQSVRKARLGIAVKKTLALLSAATGAILHGRGAKAGVLIISALISRVLLFAGTTLVNLAKARASLIVLLTALWVLQNWMRANARKWLMNPLVRHGLIVG